MIYSLLIINMVSFRQRTPGLVSPTLCPLLPELIVSKHTLQILFILLLYIFRSDNPHPGSDTGKPAKKLQASDQMKPWSSSPLSVSTFPSETFYILCICFYIYHSSHLISLICSIGMTV